MPGLAPHHWRSHIINQYHHRRRRHHGRASAIDVKRVAPLGTQTERVVTHPRARTEYLHRIAAAAIVLQQQHLECRVLATSTVQKERTQHLARRDQGARFNTVSGSQTIRLVIHLFKYYIVPTYRATYRKLKCPPRARFLCNYAKLCATRATEQPCVAV